MINNRILSYCFLAMVAFNGCHCKKQEPEPVPPVLNAFEYFPNNKDKQWIFEVQKVDYTVNPSKLVYVYDDTMCFVKDSILTKNPTNPTIFKFYDFKKKHDFMSFTVGRFYDEDELLRLLMDNIALPLYDLDRVSSDGASIRYNTDGLPINKFVKSTYYSPAVSNYQTAIGDLKVINSYASYENSNATYYLNYSHTFKFADNIGPVTYKFDYKYKNTSLNIDSVFTVFYKIKKVIN